MASMLLIPYFCFFFFFLGKFTQKGKFSHYLLTLMPVKIWVKFCSPQNISGVFKQYSIAAFSKTTDPDRDLFLNRLKKTKPHLS